MRRNPEHTNVIEPEERLSHLDAGPIPNQNRVRQNAEVPGSDVSDELLREDGQRADSWLHYNKGAEQIGSSPANRITPETIEDLTLEYTVDTVNGLGDCVAEGQEANPTIVPGDPPVIYLSQGKMHVNALNARTGEGYWKFEYGIEEIDASGVRNRGVAVWKDTAYVAFPDETAVPPRLVAIDRYTGEQRWEVNLMTEEQREFDAPLADRLFITQEPMVYDGTVFIGQSSDKAAWTYLLAFDAETGEQRWKWQVGKPDEWVGETWQFSSGAAWMTPTVDPTSGTVFFSTTNPDPMLNGVVRPGPNKHTQSIVALDAETGERKWSHQMLAHELWDYDASNSPFVFDMEVDGEERRVVAQAGKVGWLYVFDAENGRLLERSAAFTRQDHWGEGFLNFPPAGEDNQKEMWPSFNGAHEWLPESYSPQTGLYYTGSNDNVMTVAYDSEWEYDSSKNYADSFAIGGYIGYPDTADVESRVAAIDPATGDIEWTHTLEDVPTDSPAGHPFTGGTTATAGGVVFHGSSGGHLVALDATTGDRLWRADTGGRIAAQPVVWDDPEAGTQYVAVTSNSEQLHVYGLEAEPGDE
ncbi:PQQ-binding-like beta-propeller repeat protein [Natrinema caseinilyticum]|uniref:outer membrane protein assembly factor BamB family protein n=1 Tax=Natrinema caseinilyticum TaxID=2961570 RepID=UPI0020C45D71|nr:PQQ-binding-like beta-propeller repeat protein [Natrinema caseinilyticum]